MSSLQIPAEAHKFSAFTFKHFSDIWHTQVLNGWFFPEEWLHGLNSRPRRQWPLPSGQYRKTLIISRRSWVYLQSHLQKTITPPNSPRLPFKFSWCNKDKISFQVGAATLPVRSPWELTGWHFIYFFSCDIMQRHQYSSIFTTDKKGHLPVKIVTETTKCGILTGGKNIGNKLDSDRMTDRRFVQSASEICIGFPNAFAQLFIIQFTETNCSDFWNSPSGLAGRAYSCVFSFYFHREFYWIAVF